MSGLTAPEVSGMITQWAGDGQERWPVSPAAGAYVAYMVLDEVLARDFPLADVVVSRPTLGDIDTAVARTLGVHAEAGENLDVSIATPAEILAATLPAQLEGTLAKAVAGLVGALTGLKMPRVRQLNPGDAELHLPGDPEFEAARKALESPEAVQRAARLLGVAAIAIAAGRGDEISRNYRKALAALVAIRHSPADRAVILEKAASHYYPAVVIGKGGNMLRAVTAEEPGCHIDLLIAAALEDAGIPDDEYAQAMRHNLTAILDDDLLQRLRPKRPH